jgi:hypothetical protein
VRLNKFIYDPNRSGGKTVLDAAKGAVRFSTGAQGGNHNYQVKTSYRTLGIRGLRPRHASSQAPSGKLTQSAWSIALQLAQYQWPVASCESA